jgi:hypothetical protein
MHDPGFASRIYNSCTSVTDGQQLSRPGASAAGIDTSGAQVGFMAGTNSLKEDSMYLPPGECSIVVICLISRPSSYNRTRHTKGHHSDAAILGQQHVKQACVTSAVDWLLLK